MLIILRTWIAEIRIIHEVPKTNENLMVMVTTTWLGTLMFRGRKVGEGGGERAEGLGGGEGGGAGGGGADDRHYYDSLWFDTYT